MDSNLYQAPSTETIAPELDKQQAALYVVSTKKFALLFMLTLGLYGVYWNYRHWKLLKEHRGANVIPVLRGIFSIFFIHSLLKHINEELGEDNSKDHLMVPQLAAIYIILNVISSISDRLSARSETVGIMDFISLILLPFICAVIANIQQAANLSQGDPKGDSNSEMTALNWIWMLMGAALWLLIIFGFAVMLAPDSIPF
ncbi:hypothetical protein [Alcanivorax sediminis]|uniref:DUF4234 domain-containing protein n=1 Tax=Alcanivorax sediminis TaxID=2663008 RepID=A0A6N7LZ43_9GAMM|nr:hypothetical protein [Alcanivorax sediminis]MQX54696.1 hypothetical protein [Alcanivorax sediminis]